MNNIKIVPMNADHLESLERLERICFSRPWSRKMLAEELENWLYHYKEIYRSVSRESELSRIQEIIIWYADYLRGKENLG